MKPIAPIRACIALAVLIVAMAILPPPFSGVEARAETKVVKLGKDSRVGKLQVVKGYSESIRINIPFSEIVVGDPETADINPLTDQTLYVLGLKFGITNIALFDDKKRLVGVIDVEVTQDIEGLREALRQSLPNSAIKVRWRNGRVVLEGAVPSAPAAERAMTIARDFAGDEVTNSLRVHANQQVNLEVRFVEVNRAAGKELGVNWNLTDNGNGATGGSGIIRSLPPTIGLGALSQTLPFGTVIANILGNGVSPDLVIAALEQKKLARRLAEPNLTALSGDTASFHAGGEFPIPVAQNDNEVTIEFKEFGVKLDFTPTVLDDGLINLAIAPEVSEIDVANSVRLTQGGVLIPGLSVRRAKTHVELRDGQSFAIAGLLQTVNAKTVDQVPWLGNVPVLGTLFRSSAFQKKESDLVIIVTPRLVRPVDNSAQLRTPLDDPLSSNEPELFLFGKTEVSRKDLDKKYHGVYGHILDYPQVNYGSPNK